MCGNVIFKCVDSGVEVVCCGKQMEELIPATDDSAAITVCGYEHVGTEPPKKCPKCGVDDIYFDAVG